MVSDFGGAEFKCFEVSQERCVARQLEYCFGIQENGGRERRGDGRTEGSGMNVCIRLWLNHGSGFNCPDSGSHLDGPHSIFNTTIAAVIHLALTYISSTYKELSMYQTLAFTLYRILTIPEVGAVILLLSHTCVLSCRRATCLKSRAASVCLLVCKPRQLEPVLSASRFRGRATGGQYTLSV